MSDTFRSFRVALTVTVRVGAEAAPDTWDWCDLLAIDGINDNLDVQEIAEIPVNALHVQQMREQLA